MNHFKIIVPFFNVEPWVGRTLDSLLIQKYKNFECLLIDDMSTDGASYIIEQKIKGDNRFKLIKNEEKKYALRNLYDGINLVHPNKDDIIVTLDGDDWFNNDDVIGTLDKVYNESQCWLTYGNYVRYPTGEIGHCTKYPDYVINNGLYRHDSWRASQLRTFKYGLWEKINTDDFKDEDGSFYSVAWDFAFMFPMLEMAAERHVFIDKILYVYNIETPLSDNKLYVEKQLAVADIIRKKTSYQRIESL